MMSWPRWPRIVSLPEPPASWSPVWLPMISVVTRAAVDRHADRAQRAWSASAQSSRCASMTSLPLYLNGFASGKTKNGALFPTRFRTAMFCPSRAPGLTGKGGPPGKSATADHEVQRDLVP